MVGVGIMQWYTIWIGEFDLDIWGGLVLGDDGDIY